MTEESKQSTADRAQAAKPTRSRAGRTIAILLVAFLLLAIVGASIYALVRYPAQGQVVTGILRDISIIGLSLTSIVIGAFLVILIFQVQSLISLLRDEIKPIMGSANQTVSTVRGTTTFLSDAVTKPVIAAASYISAIRQSARVLTGGSRRNQDNQGREARTEN